MTNRESIFLTANWSHLAMLNYEIEPQMLAPYVPPGTELDTYEGRTFASMVGFLYSDTRLCGIPVPWHRNFPEVNLRFYVRRYEQGEYRRGVVFVKEIVPRRAIAWVARRFYEENFVRLPMRYSITIRTSNDPTPAVVNYGWQHQGTWQELSVKTQGAPSYPIPGSLEEFITEHYWGYTSRSDGSTSEYRVSHPQWRVWQVSQPQLHFDVAALYGEAFVEPLTRPPASAFLAEGSQVEVYQGCDLPRKFESVPETDRPRSVTV